MKKLSLLTTFLITLFAAQAQTDSASSSEKHKIFNVSIQTLDKKTINGRLFAVNDSQLVLSKPSGYYTVPSENIKSFTLKRKNSVLKGTLIGFGIGVVTGVVAGLASGDDPIQQAPADDPFGLGALAAGIGNSFRMTAGEKALAGGAIMGTTGALIGTIIGAVAKKSFTIGGKKEKFRDLQAEIMMKLVQK